MADPAPPLTEQQLRRLRAYGRPEVLEVGDAFFATGDASYDLIVIESGAVELTREATPGPPATKVIRFDAGGFVGELGLGASVVRSVRVAIGSPHTTLVGRDAERPSSAQAAARTDAEPTPALASQGQGDPQCQ